MAFSAANSTPKRRTTPTHSPSSSSPSKDDKIPIRRSKSVSAASRSNGSVPFSSKSASLSDEYLNKRDNPLYGCASSSSSSSSLSPQQGSDPLDDGSGRRGRSVSRSSGGGSQSTGSTRIEKSGRSLSRVDAGTRRIRSVSREHYRNSSETDREHNCKYVSRLTSEEDDRSSTSKGQRKNASTKFDAKENTRNLQTWTSRHPISESWDVSSLCSQPRNWEDGTSTSSFSEAEEPIVSAIFQGDYALGEDNSCAIYETVQSEVRRVVSEIRDDLENAFCRKNPAIVTTENIGVTSPECVNPDELVSDVRKEYTSKLEQSQERARKLRADLAVEEQREQELSRILTEIIHTPRNSNSQNSRPKRKASIERLRMSRRLAEEAMNYFDECVSISTFDSSDFSSLEDPQPNSIIGIPHMGSSRFLQSDGSNYSIPDFRNRHALHHELQEVDNQTQCSLSITGSDVAINSSYSGSNTPRSGNFWFSSGHNTMKAVGVHDIDQYIMKFDKGSKKESLKNVTVSSSYRSEDYELSAKAESLIFDSLILRNQIESGGLLLCNIRIL